VIADFSEKSATTMQKYKKIRKFFLWGRKISKD
jgi:hypothetical protein